MRSEPAAAVSPSETTSAVTECERRPGYLRLGCKCGGWEVLEEGNGLFPSGQPCIWGTLAGSAHVVVGSSTSLSWVAESDRMLALPLTGYCPQPPSSLPPPLS